MEPVVSPRGCGEDDGLVAWRPPGAARRRGSSVRPGNAGPPRAVRVRPGSGGLHRGGLATSTWTSRPTTSSVRHRQREVLPPEADESLTPSDERRDAQEPPTASRPETASPGERYLQGQGGWIFCEIGTRSRRPRGHVSCGVATCPSKRPPRRSRPPRGPPPRLRGPRPSRVPLPGSSRRALGLPPEALDARPQCFVGLLGTVDRCSHLVAEVHPPQIDLDAQVVQAGTPPGDELLHGFARRQRSSLPPTGGWRRSHGAQLRARRRAGWPPRGRTGRRPGSTSPPARRAGAPPSQSERAWSIRGGEALPCRLHLVPGPVPGVVQAVLQAAGRDRSGWSCPRWCSASLAPALHAPAGPVPVDRVVDAAPRGQGRKSRFEDRSSSPEHRPVSATGATRASRGMGPRAR